MNTEIIRNKYLPKRIRLLLVGESPPNKGKFFYVASSMTTFTSRPFEDVFNVQFSDNQEFLKYFQEKQCFLDDLSHEPVDHLPKPERELMLKNSIPHLAERLKAWEPKVVCIALRKIEPYVREAISISGIDTKIYVLPFAGNGHQNKYIAELTEIVRENLVE